MGVCPSCPRAGRRRLGTVKNESRIRQLRSTRYRRLAALHGGPLGVALIGRPELAPSFERAMRHCPGHPDLLCAGVGGAPRVCFVGKMEQLAASSARGGESRRAWERRFIEREVLPCLEVFEREFPRELEPMLRYTRDEIEADLAYLKQRSRAAGEP